MKNESVFYLWHWKAYFSRSAAQACLVSDGISESSHRKQKRHQPFDSLYRWQPLILTKVENLSEISPSNWQLGVRRHCLHGEAKCVRCLSIKLGSGRGTARMKIILTCSQEICFWYQNRKSNDNWSADHVKLSYWSDRRSSVYSAALPRLY